MRTRAAAPGNADSLLYRVTPTPRMLRLFEHIAVDGEPLVLPAMPVVFSPAMPARPCEVGRLR